MSDTHMELQIIYRDKHGRSIERHTYANPREPFLLASLGLAFEAVNRGTHPLVKSFTVHYEPTETP